MRDDYSALDLLSIEGFGRTSGKMRPLSGIKRFSLRRKPKKTARRKLSAYLPILGAKVTAKMMEKTRFHSLQGWPVALHWPTKVVDNRDLWVDGGDRPLS